MASTIALGLSTVVGAACGAKHDVQSADIQAEATQGGAGEKDQVTQASVKGKGRARTKDRPQALIYRQAGEQARQRLTADNAHLRLDELDAQIDHEKESRPSSTRP